MLYSNLPPSYQKRILERHAPATYRQRNLFLASLRIYRILGKAQRVFSARIFKTDGCRFFPIDLFT